MEYTFFYFQTKNSLEDLCSRKTDETIKTKCRILNIMNLYNFPGTR